MEDKVSDLKRVIGAIVISSPKKLTVKELKFAYEEIEGKTCPFFELGFKSFGHFLSSIPDVVQIDNSSLYSIVSPVYNEKTDRIFKLVQNQRNQSRNINYSNGKKHNVENNRTSCSFATDCNVVTERMDSSNHPGRFQNDRYIKQEREISRHVRVGTAENPVYQNDRQIKHEKEIIRPVHVEVTEKPVYPRYKLTSNDVPVNIHETKDEGDLEGVPSFDELILSLFELKVCDSSFELPRHPLLLNSYIGAIYNITCDAVVGFDTFYGHLCQQEYDIAEFTSELRDFYSKHGSVYHLQGMGTLKRGYVLACLHAGQWYRCTILERIKLTSVKVWLVDHGRSAILSENCLYFMPEYLGKRPAYTIKMKLLSVDDLEDTVSKNKELYRECMGRKFKQMVHNKQCKIVVKHISPEEQYLDVKLLLRSTESCVNCHLQVFGELLIRRFNNGRFC